MHPTAIPNNRSGAFGMRAGDRVRYTLDGRTGIADEFLSDGEAFVSFDDGVPGTVKWNHLELAGTLADWLRTQRHDAALAAELAERAEMLGLEP